MRKEIFGPVIPIMRVADEDEAVRLANDSHLGLLAYVFTRDREHGKRLAERIEAGTVMINDVLNTYGVPRDAVGRRQAERHRPHALDASACATSARPATSTSTGSRCRASSGGTRTRPAPSARSCAARSSCSASGSGSADPRPPRRRRYGTRP